MGIAYNEYGPYDEATGKRIFQSESGTVFEDGTPYNPNSTAATAQSNEGYVVRGNYRMPKSQFGLGGGASGAMEVQDASGNWVPVTAANAPAGYDARQNSDTQGSNERLRFDQAFGTAPADVPITDMQQWAMENGWQEPDRSQNDGTLGAMLKDIAPGVLSVLGVGMGANALFGAPGAGAGGQSLASLAADGLGGYAPTGFGTGAGTAGSGGGMWDSISSMFSGGGSSGASELIPSIANSADPIEAMYQAMQATGTTSAGEAASALGFGSFEALASAINPAWVGTSLGTMLNNTGNSIGSALGGSGSSGSTDWMKTIGSLGAAGLGAYASNEQTNSLEDMAQRYEGYGAPYRQKLSDLYANPDSFLSSNEVQKPVQQGTDALMRSLSMTGNPFGSGNALQQGQSYASDQLFGKLGQEKDRLANFGGLSTYNSAAPTAATNAIQSSGNTYNAIGSGLGNIFNPPQTGAQTLAELMKSLGGR